MDISDRSLIDEQEIRLTHLPPVFKTHITKVGKIEKQNLIAPSQIYPMSLQEITDLLSI